MTLQEEAQIMQLVKPVAETLAAAVELRIKFDHAVYLLRYARERMATSTVHAEIVDQIDKFLKEHNR